MELAWKSLILLVFCSSQWPCHHRNVLASPSRSDWSKLDLTALEEEWKAGDSEEDLATPDDELYRLIEKKRERALDKMNSLIGGALEKAAFEAQNVGKAAMIFATLRRDKAPKKLKKKDGDSETSIWDWDSMAEVCDEWTLRLGYALVEVTCYPIESDSTILLTTSRGWNGEDIYNYLVQHDHPSSIVEKVTWDDRTTNFLESRFLSEL